MAHGDDQRGLVTCWTWEPFLLHKVNSKTLAFTTDHRNGEKRIGIIQAANTRFHNNLKWKKWIGIKAGSENCKQKVIVKGSQIALDCIAMERHLARPVAFSSKASAFAGPSE